MSQAQQPAGLRQFCYGKIHRCVVTEANVDYVGSITIDPLLLAAAGLLPYTLVDVVNVTSGGRLQTYIIPGTTGQGDICLNGAAAHLFKKGDYAIIMGYELVASDALPGRLQKAVMVDELNQITEVFTYTVPTLEQLANNEVPSRTAESYIERRALQATAEDTQALAALRERRLAEGVIPPRSYSQWLAEQSAASPAAVTAISGGVEVNRGGNLDAADVHPAAAAAL